MKKLDLKKNHSYFHHVHSCECVREAFSFIAMSSKKIQRCYSDYSYRFILATLRVIRQDK